MLVAGTRLGAYEILEPLGQGGMGEVYRARDTELRREIALKILPAGMAGDADRLARFRREAELLASLNHPNISILHGIVDEAGTTALVLELIEGRTLADRIAEGPMPFEEAAPLARQIAEAVEAAHEAGVLHRDLKPANIKVRPDGMVKVLDFGLAKALAPDGSGRTADASITLTTPADTHIGAILGTPAYMAPEQVKGRAAGTRADIWAYGCVLYEMLSGGRAFAGDDVAETLAATLRQEPDWTALGKDVPPRMVQLLKRCLQKDPRVRLRHIGDARLELLDARSAPDPVAPPPAEARAFSRRGTIAAAIAGLVAGGLATWGLVALLRPATAARPPLARTSIRLPAAAPFFIEFYPGSCVAISPDGSTVVYCSGDPERRLHLRRLDDLTVRPVEGTAGASGPFFSPDGGWLAFFTRDGQLKKLSLAGGNPVTLARDLPYAAFVLGSWGRSGRIVFDTWNEGLRTVAAEGGPVETLTAPDGVWHQSPEMLPQSDTLLYSVLSDDGYRIEAGALGGGDARVVLDNASHARHLSSGHLLFTREGTLMTVPFDADRLAVAGPAVPVPIAAVVDDAAAGAPIPQLAVSRNGTLVYVPGPLVREASFVWMDRSGRATELPPYPLTAPLFRLSPDETRAAIVSRHGVSVRLQVLDLEAGSLTLLADYRQDYPTMVDWSPDGRRLFVGAFGTHRSAIYAHDLAGNAPRERLLDQAGTWLAVTSISRDARWLLYTIISDARLGIDVWALDLAAAGGKPAGRPFISTAANESGAAFSPDGHWVAYVSDEQGANDIYVRRFPGGESKQRVGAGVGLGAPVWSSDGRELFFLTKYGATLTALPIEAADTVSVGQAQAVVSGRFAMQANWPSMGVARDGRRFLMLNEGHSAAFRAAPELIVVQGWLSEIERLAPAGGTR